MPKVYIIILNWNGLKDTLECLESVYKLNYLNYEVIVVDNSSSDDSVDTIRQKYQQVILIENDNNLGFTGGNNVGMRRAMELGADYVWLLNNDTVVEPNSLTKLVEKAESSEDLGMVSPSIYCYGDRNRKQFIGSYVDWDKLRILYPDRKCATKEEFKYHGQNICLWGTALLIKTSTIKNIGYLNNNYFAYREDIEYSLRSIRSGFRNGICQEAKIYHKTPLDSSSLPKGKHYYYFMQRNSLFLGKTYLDSYSQKCSFYKDYCSTFIATIGAFWQAGEIDKFNTCLNAAWHGVKGVSGPMTDDNPMPKHYVSFFKAIAGWHPFFVSNLINCSFRAVFNEICRRCKAMLAGAAR